MQTRLQPIEIARHHRLYIGIGAGGRDALVLADFRTHIGRQRDPQVRQRALENFLRALLVGSIREALQKCDCNAFDALFPKRRHQRRDRGFIQRQQYAPLGVDALGHGQAQVAWDQRRRLVEKNIVLREAVLPPDFNEIAETFRSHERSLCTLALYQRVGCECRAEDKNIQRAGLELRLREYFLHCSDHRFFRRARRGEHLAGPALSVGFEHDVGEGAADIDGEARGCWFCC